MGNTRVVSAGVYGIRNTEYGIYLESYVGRNTKYEIRNRDYVSTKYNTSTCARSACASHSYRILRRIGLGGMGAVYEAYDYRLNNKVAIKQALVSDAALRRAFEKEAQRLARLRDPSLPNVMDHFVEDEGQYLVMEFIDGQDLEQMLHQRGQPFTVEQVAISLLVGGDALYPANGCSAG